MRRAAVVGAVACTLLWWPAAAGAHGLGKRANLPLPEWLFGTAAAVVLVVSFLALAVLWSRPRIEGANGWRPLPRVGRLLGSARLELACHLVGVLLLLVVLVACFAGVQEPADNFAPTFVYITFWVGL